MQVRLTKNLGTTIIMLHIEIRILRRNCNSTIKRMNIDVVYLLTHMIVRIPQETKIKEIKIVEEVEARLEVLDKSLFHIQFM
jgi:DNA phosphorothioation-dependent restriction protein DptG